MTRPLRIEYPGAFYHVTSRGNERRSIFRAKQDYERFLGYLNSATERYGARVHCFCLMPNHYHLLLETPRGNLSVILHHLNTSYTNYFNGRTGRVGHLFQGRYRAILVEKDSYALELSRYIHLNPVRAYLVRDLSEYGWSSYSSYIGRGKRWEWLQTDFIVGQMSLDLQEASRRYRDYLKEGMGKRMGDPLRKTVASTVLGSEKFVEWVKESWMERGASHRDIPALGKLAPWPDLSAIRRESEGIFGEGTAMSRKVGLYLSHRVSGRSLEEIGDFYGGIGPSAVSQNSRRLKDRLKGDRKLSEEVNRLKERLSE